MCIIEKFILEIVFDFENESDRNNSFGGCDFWTHTHIPFQHLQMEYCVNVFTPKGRRRRRRSWSWS